MSVPISEFWRLLMESRLLTHEQCQQLSADFARARPSKNGADAKSLAKWLIKANVISLYQGRLLLAGRPGPFLYGDYLVYDRVAEGRFKGMFRAVHGATRHPVLLQFLAGDLTEDEEAWQAFVQETRRECEFSHPGLQRCFELVDLDDYKFLVLEDLHGEAVADQLAKGKLDAAEACRIVRRAALTLNDLHATGRVHGDLHPKNLFLDSDRRVRLLRDLASPPGPFPWGRPDPHGELLSRGDYLAPEMSQTGRPPDPLTDIYALGCTFYQMTTGVAPFPGDDLLQKMHQHATARIRPVEEFGAPPHLGQIIVYMMAKNPQLRYQEAASVAEQLTPWVPAGELHVQPPAPPATLAAFESHLQQKRTAETQRQPAARRVVPVGAAAGGPSSFETQAKPAPRISATSSIPDFATLAAKSGPAATPVRVERKKAEMTPQKLGIILGSLGALVIVMLIAISFLGDDEEPVPGENVAAVGEDAALPDERLTGDGSEDSSDGPSQDTPAPKASREPEGVSYQVAADDGELPWMSPTAGQPINLALSPAGAQAFFVFRPAEVLASPHGAEVIQGLGPRFAAMVERWEADAGLKLSEVEQMVIGLHAGGGAMPRASIVVRTRDNLDEPALLSRWGNPSPQTSDGATTYAARGWSFYVPRDQRGVFLMGHATEVEDVAKNPQDRPLLRREMERLLRVSDSERHVSLLFAPNFLFSDGQKLFSGDLEKLRAPLETFLGDGLQAGLASAHLGDRFYLEMRLYGSLDRDKGRLASEMRERLAQMPDQIEDYIARLTPHPYWRKTALRFPPMIRALHQQTRIGTEADHAIINAALPGKAAPNLAVATELTLVSQPGAEYVAEAAPARPKVTTMEELLEHKISISFPQQALDFSMQEVANEVRDALPDLPFPFEIKLMGKDLEMNGITQNQQIRDFEARDKPVKEVLTMMVMKANPIQTVKSPNEEDQKLIWVVGPDPEEPSKQIILITTRDAAAAKEYNLPEAFR
jgi:eukaryotic-like serine/threonine-protein kinase